MCMDGFVAFMCGWDDERLKMKFLYVIGTMNV